MLGLSASVEQCCLPTSLPDAEVGLGWIIRQAAAIDTNFSRRNVTSGTASITPNPAYSANQHSSDQYGQTYYVQNEPEAYSPATSQIDDMCVPTTVIVDPRDNIIDRMNRPQAIPPGTAGFWETKTIDNVTQRRITPLALALIFLRIRNLIEGKGRFHMLHLHQYAAPRDRVLVDQQNPAAYPLETVAENAYEIKTGVNWFRQQYNPNAPLNMDILLSEMGPLWLIKSDANNVRNKWVWAGGWNNFYDGLS
jgi:hypothetical protein